MRLLRVMAALSRQRAPMSSTVHGRACGPWRAAPVIVEVRSVYSSDLNSVSKTNLLETTCLRATPEAAMHAHMLIIGRL
jgi:hypothetical protein